MAGAKERVSCRKLLRKLNFLLDFKLSPCFESCMYFLGISPASDCGLPTFRNPLSVPSSRAGCRGFRNVGKPQSDAGEIPKRIQTIFKTRRKFEIKKGNIVEWDNYRGRSSLSSQLFGNVGHIGLKNIVLPRVQNSC